MTKADPLNLIANPRNLQSAAEATRRQRARERREKDAGLLGKEILIRPEHRRSGVEARKRSLAVEMSEKATQVATRPRERPTSPFSASERAIADLCHALGYPEVVVQTPKGRVHKLVVAEDRDDEPVEKAVRHGFEGRYRELDGKVERQCIGCNQWLDFTPEFWQRHSSKGVAWWDSRCRPCALTRRREIWRAKHAKRVG